MKEYLWKLLAYIVSRKPVADWLIRRSWRTPYIEIPDYMERWWLFNRYSEIGSFDRVERRFPKLPSIRIHHILRADVADHLHDHPWNARTIILKGWYEEVKETGSKFFYQQHRREAGDTAPINFGEYHHIKEVSPGGVWTLFFTWEYKGMWGFLVDGKKMPWREYEASGRRT